MEKQACSSLPLGAGTHPGPQGLLHRNPRTQTRKNEPAHNSLKQNTVQFCQQSHHQWTWKYVYKQLQKGRLLLIPSYLREKVCVCLKEKSVRKSKAHSNSISNEVQAALGSRVAMSLPVFFSFCTRSHIILQKKNNREKKRKKRSPSNIKSYMTFSPLPSISIMMVTHVLNLTKFYNNVICVYSYTPVLNFTSVQLLSPVRLFGTPWTTAHQASLSINNSQSLLKLMTIA